MLAHKLRRKRDAGGAARTMPSFVAVGRSTNDGYGFVGVPAFSASNALDIFIALTDGGTTPTNYTSWGTITVNSRTLRVSYKVRTAGTEAHGLSSSYNSQGVVCWLMRNVDNSDPIEDFKGAFLATNNTNVDFAALASANENSMAVLSCYAPNGGSVAVSSASFADLANVTERFDAGTSAQLQYIGGYTGEDATAGSIAAGTFTLASSRNNKYGLGFVLNGKP